MQCTCCMSYKGQLMMHEDLIKRLKKLFKAVDLDGNGNLEPEEILKFAGGNKQFAADLMFDLDEDQDGKITMEEWLTYFAKRLEDDGMEGMMETLEKMERNKYTRGEYEDNDMADYDKSKADAAKKKTTYDKRFEKAQFEKG